MVFFDALFWRELDFCQVNMSCTCMTPRSTPFSVGKRTISWMPSCSDGSGTTALELKAGKVVVALAAA